MQVCTPEKKSESVVSELPKTDTTAVVEHEPSQVALVTPEPEIIFNTIKVEKNTWLEDLVGNPFLLEDVSTMKERLDSLGVASEYEPAEFGNLAYDRSLIYYNTSYGEAICTADIQSTYLPLNKGIIIGMPVSDFLNWTGIEATSKETNLRYEYVHAANDHVYTIRFDFIDEVLFRFYYERDPCVIFD